MATLNLKVRLEFWESTSGATLANELSLFTFYNKKNLIFLFSAEKINYLPNKNNFNI